MSKQKLVNFRDFGGLVTPYGTMKAGKLYRTAAFLPKTAADRALIEGMRLDCVVDLRTEAERREQPDVLPTGVEYVPASVFSEEGDNALAPTKDAAKAMFKMKEEEFAPLMGKVRDSYRDMPFSPAYGEIFKRMDEGKTIAFHCTAGKDRTGVGAMLVELAFGRTFDEAEARYLASNEYRRKENERVTRYLRLMGLKPYAVRYIRELLGTNETLFLTAKNAITEQYASVKDFLEDVHGITEERLKAWHAFYLK